MSKAQRRRQPSGPQTRSQRFERLIYREFLLEPELYLEAGLRDLPERLGELMGCPARDALDRIAQGIHLDAVDIERLRALLCIEDRELTESTPESVAQQLGGPEVSYDKCIRSALRYAVVGMRTHVFAALRAAAQKRDDWARHHFVYGLLHGLEDNRDRALWELNMALAREPYQEGRERIQAAIALLERGA